MSNGDMASWLYQVLSCRRPQMEKRDASDCVETTVSPFETTLQSKLDPEIASGSLSREDMLSRDSFSIESPGSAGQPASGGAAAAVATRGILQSNKGRKTWTASNFDQEKFVRFGE